MNLNNKQNFIYVFPRKYFNKLYFMILIAETIIHFMPQTPLLIGLQKFVKHEIVISHSNILQIKSNKAFFKI